MNECGGSCGFSPTGSAATPPANVLDRGLPLQVARGSAFKSGGHCLGGYDGKLHGAMEKAAIVLDYVEATSMHTFAAGARAGTRANSAATQAVAGCIYAKAHPVSTCAAIALVSDHHWSQSFYVCATGGFALLAMPGRLMALRVTTTAQVEAVAYKGQFEG